MINWRCIADVGNPTDSHKTYLVSDGIDISTSNVTGITYYRGDGNPKFTFKGWIGDEYTYEDNSCCSGTRMFDMTPTHWCPTDELELPQTNKDNDKKGARSS
jgi:hypothetical protein